MKIGLVLYGGLSRTSGGYLYDRMLVDNLRSRGHRVSPLPIAEGGYLRHLSQNLGGSLLSRMRSSKPDLVLEDELCHPSLVVFNRRLRTILPVPIVSIVHHLRWEEPHTGWLLPVYRYVESAYLKSVDGFVCNTRSTLRSVRAIGGSAPATVALPAGDHLGPGLTKQAIVQRARGRGPLHILYVGNVIPRKGLHALLDALERIPGAHWDLTVAGDLTLDGAYSGAIRRQADRSGWGDRVRFTGGLPPRRVAAELRRAHVLAVPSALEGFGIAYLEGMAFGLPAIASAAGGAKELVRDSRNGFLIPPGDSALLASRLQQLAEDRRLLARMGQAARATYARHPTWRDSARPVEQFLLGLLAHPGVS